MEGIIFDVKRYAIHDGPGIRVTVFLKGCPLGCLWCHNPEGIAPGLDEYGRSISVDELMTEIAKDRPFMEESGGGVTLSGGEPLYQPEFLLAVMRECRDSGIHVTLDTCGYGPADVFDSTLDLVDLYLYDLKFMDDELHRKYTGVSNDIVIRNCKKLDELGKNTIIRFPVIPEITGKDANIMEIGGFLASLNNIKTLDLLPYHRTAEGKYERMGLDNQLAGVNPPSVAYVDSVHQKLTDHGLEILVGGSA